MIKVCIIGLGYIGLPTASLIANQGMDVYGVDCVSQVVETINAGKIHIVEPGLGEFVRKAVQSGKLRAGVQPVEADVFLIAVPTPFREAHRPDLSYVRAAAKEIAPYVKAGNLVILESTSPVGTTESVMRWVLEERPDLASDAVYFAHCPERVLPGRILQELVSNDRIVGGVDAVSTEKAMAFYRNFVEGELLSTNSRTAELAKLTENSFRDVNIAFANELSMICEKLNVDVWELIRLANRHPRVNILQPGPGVGGHCIAVDPWFIVDSAPKDARLIRVAREVNDNKPAHVIEKLMQAVKGLEKPTVACLGLAFKPDIDDLRESPALRIVEELAARDFCKLLVVEPNIAALPQSLQEHANVFLTALPEAVRLAEVVLLLVDHREFKQMDRSLLTNKFVIDTRGIFDEAGFDQKGTSDSRRGTCAAS